MYTTDFFNQHYFTSKNFDSEMELHLGKNYALKVQEPFGLNIFDFTVATWIG